MALVTIQRSPSASSSPPSSEYDGSTNTLEEEASRLRSLSEYYFAVKGFGVLLPKNECQVGCGRRSTSAPAEIQNHLQAMLNLLRPGDTLHMAVKLESLHVGRVRYLAVVGTVGKQDTEEACLLGVDFSSGSPSIGLVLPVLADTRISLDGDGGFSVSTSGRTHIFKPITVQAMWSALQTLHKSSSKAQEYHYFQGGLNHDWVCFYNRGVTSDQSCINEWNAMDSLVSKRPPSPDSLTDKEETQLLIRSKLKEIMMSVDIDEVTSKYIRQQLEKDLNMDLYKFKEYIDQEMLTILGQMDSATEIFPHVYLGSEWNASNLEELQRNGVGYILNVTKEIDNFYPGMFDYLNIRVYDDEKTELLRHWENTYKYITQAKEKGSKVLVHCKMGISRSASVVIAYAMKAFNMELEDASHLVKRKRSCIKPNQAFCSQLKTYQGILDASRQRHNALWRSKSETNLKPPQVQVSPPQPLSASTNDNSTMPTHQPNNGNREINLHHMYNNNNNINNRQNNGDMCGEKQDLCDKGEPEFRMCERRSGGGHVAVAQHAILPRPKSWSPDDHTANILFPQHHSECGSSDDISGGEVGGSGRKRLGGSGDNHGGDGESSECWRRSQSLNQPAWEATVTLQTSQHVYPSEFEPDTNVYGSQEDKNNQSLSPVWLVETSREMLVEGSNRIEADVVEAINPIYISQKHQEEEKATGEEEDDPVISSSVKERISEFESVQGSVGSPSSVSKNTEVIMNQESSTSDRIKRSPGWKKPTGENPLSPTIGVLPTAGSPFSHEAADSTKEYDETPNRLLCKEDTPHLEGNGPILSQTKPAAQKHQAILIPSSVCHDDQIKLSSPSSAVMCSLPPQEQQIQQQQQPQQSHSQSQALPQEHQDSNVVMAKDSISWPAGIVKKQRQDFEEMVKASESKSPKTKEAEVGLSRQGSSASLPGLAIEGLKKEDIFSQRLDKVFDREEKKEQKIASGNPVISDLKETPSRNSSWGSFDSAVVLGDRDTPSRQSSWGSCDTRFTRGSTSSRNSSFGGTDLKQPTQYISQICDNYENHETYFNKDPGPYSPGTVRRKIPKSSGEEVRNSMGSAPEEIHDEGVGEQVKEKGSSPPQPMEHCVSARQSGTQPPQQKDDDDTSSCRSSGDCNGKGCAGLHHCQSTPSLSIHLMAACPSLTQSQPDISSLRSSGTPKAVQNSASTKTSPVSEEEIPVKGTVRQQKQFLESLSQKLPPLATSRSFSNSPTELQQLQQKNEPLRRGRFGRSFSEKRAKFEGEVQSAGVVQKMPQFPEQGESSSRVLHFRQRSHSIERLSTSPSSPCAFTQRQLVEQLLKQANIEHEVECEGSIEEICVKSLVGKFEDPKDKVPSQKSGMQTMSESSNGEKTSKESPDKPRPPVPQRKSSLDYNFKPTTIRATSQPPSASSQNWVNSGGPSTPPATSRPPAIQKPQANGNGTSNSVPGMATVVLGAVTMVASAAAPVEVRRKKQQGKTHPITVINNRHKNHTM
ncbi:protein phosphatase Slingshot isoform X2 [Oratosquilla oratoria]|uniref:protein phosphatase Slingshot isoform X2 n=1 Tax=Oratosquilla oratoria TaxID=337810 RepID=UPI003F775AAF